MIDWLGAIEDPVSERPVQIAVSRAPLQVGGDLENLRDHGGDHQPDALVRSSTTTGPWDACWIGRQWIEYRRGV